MGMGVAGMIITYMITTVVMTGNIPPFPTKQQQVIAMDKYCVDKSSTWQPGGPQI